MRADMDEVIIERPRWGHWLRYPRTRVRNRTRAREGGEETFPLREPMGGFYAAKSLSDNLAPLERYLRSQVGRPWAKVRSEIAAQLSVTSALQKHVLDHLKQYVVERVYEDDAGRLRGADRFGRPVVPWRFFVHPRSGALAEMPPRPRTKASRARVRRPDVRVLGPDRELRRVRGIWYEVEIAALPFRHGPDAVPFVRDAIAKLDPRRLDYDARDESMRDLWDENRYARSIRQLSKREIRRWLGGAP
ncbi:MAG: hypothetical protein KIT84_14885 [Labilithrix sp.]|nr:hypothetical protein [Labilithrix sp.]MCW5812308.1 hypothetical protein [Labilithrix sp.]